MPQYLAQEKTPEEIFALMSKDYREYQQWNWEVFAKHAYESVVELVPDENSVEFRKTRLEKEAVFGPSLADDCPF